MSTVLAPQQEFTLGSDPEMFAKNDKNEFFPCIGLIGGTKKQPIQLNTCMAQEDNVMAEFNTVPANTKEEFLVNVRNARDEVSQLLLSRGLNVVEVSAARFRLKYLEHPQAKHFGCDPDANIYYSDPIQRRPPRTLRFAGGHIHVGIKQVDRHACIMALDATLGMLNKVLDPDPRRIPYYGRFGTIRNKSYGFEYRTMSNWWIWKDEYIKLVYELTNYCIHASLNTIHISKDFSVIRVHNLPVDVHGYIKKIFGCSIKELIKKCL
jgi:Phage phiEco32-like COOH.NH2 ligase-type 2